MLVFIICVQMLETASQDMNIPSRHPSETDIREVDFLTQNLTDPLEYKTIYDQLLYCPLVPLCDNLTRADTYSSRLDHGLMSCCYRCSCSEEGKLKGEQCPNLHLNTPVVSHTTCIRPQYFMFDQTLANIYGSYYMVQTCSPDFTDKVVIDKCISDPETYNSLDLSLYVPVTTIKADVIYKNRHCAICNYKNTENVVNWDVEMYCSSGTSFSEHPATQTELLQKIQKDKKCNLLFSHSTMSPFECDWGGYTKCNQTGKWIHYDRAIEHACNNYTSVYIGHYKNVFCFMCNENALPYMGCEEHDFVHRQSRGFGTFSGLIRYRTEPVILNTGRCQETEVYDTYKEMCRHVFCPPYFIYNSTDCEPIFDKVASVKYEALYRVKIKWESSCEAVNDIFISFQNTAETAINMVVRYIQTTMPDFTYCGDKTQAYFSMSDVRENITTFVIKLQFSNLRYHDPEFYVHALTSIPEMNTTICNITIFQISEVISKIEFEMIVDKILPIPTSLLSVFSFECMTDLDVVQVLSNYFCPRIQFNIDEVTISETKVLISSLNITYNIESVIRSGNHVTICLDPYMAAAPQIGNNKTLSDDDEIEEILSFICSTVSIIALICTLVVYSVFKELRTIPGINNMILAGHLILANSLYLFGFDATSNFNLCVAIGLLTHYFWLSSIMWMHVCSIHMFRVFFFMRKGPGIKQSKMVIFVYSIYAIIVSVLLVCVNIIYFFAGQSTVSGYLGYGGDRCYIANSNMILYTFAIPVGCVLLSNIALFCLVIFRIEKLPDVQSAGGKSRNTFVIYIKLTCLTGLSWVFGFVYQWTLVTALSYIFIILNASQGLFIFLSFSCSKRVRNMCRLKLTKGDHSKSSSTKHTPATKKSLIIDSEITKPSNQEN